jgi:hypothetical protein
MKNKLKLLNKIGVDRFYDSEIIEIFKKNKNLKEKVIIYKNINPGAKEVNSNKVFEFYRKRLKKKLNKKRLK